MNETIKKITAETGMQECTTGRQAANGTVAFRDAELGETYTIHPNTGYARRTNAWGGNYQLNDTRIAWRSFTWGTESREFAVTERVRVYDLDELAYLVIRGFNDRRSPARNYVREIAARLK